MMKKKSNTEREQKKHPSHTTRFSDASTFNEVCVNCGATDNPVGLRGSGPWGNLAKPYSKPQKE